MTTPAIPTRYAGCHFRSRLEARWAVFFDSLGIRWEYEPEGFVGLSGPYFPDFHLPDVTPPTVHPRHGTETTSTGTWVEVKGSDRQLATSAELISGAIDFQRTPVSNGLLILGNVPRVGYGKPVHSYLSWAKGIGHALVAWRHATLEVVRDVEEVVCWPDLPRDATTQALYLGGPAHPHVPWNAYHAARSARFEHGHSGAS